MKIIVGPGIIGGATHHSGMAEFSVGRGGNGAPRITALLGVVAIKAVFSSP